MKLHPIRGGVHPDYRKELTSDKAIVVLPLPAVLHIPLQQHVGAPAEILVCAGDQVKKGQMIARSDGQVSVPKHAPTSGRIKAVTDATAPHPSGLSQATIILEPDGKDEWAILPEAIADPFSVEPKVISDRVAESGIVGMGGAAFPSAVKLNLGTQYKVDTLLINGAECEPYLTCDDRLMREHAAEIIDGARIMAYALGAADVIVAIEDNKPQALAAMTSAAAAFASVKVVAIPVQYPMGSAQHLIQVVTGRETPAGQRTAAIGVVTHNVATARAVHHAVRFGRPLISRVVTLSGGAIRAPKNIEVPIGALVADLVEFCGGFATRPERLVNGGPMMGQPLPSLAVPVVKGTAGILALAAGDVNFQPASPCIRCGQCITVCPSGLVPVEMADFIRKDNLKGAARLGVSDCISCGSCSWVCPSHLPLVHYFSYAIGALDAQERERRKNEHIKILAEARQGRLEAATAVKNAYLAGRKAQATAAATATATAGEPAA